MVIKTLSKLIYCIPLTILMIEAHGKVMVQLMTRGDFLAGKEDWGISLSR